MLLVVVMEWDDIMRFWTLKCFWRWCSVNVSGTILIAKMILENFDILNVLGTIRLFDLLPI